MRAAFPLSEHKVGCEIITLQDLRQSEIVNFYGKSLSSISRGVKFVALLIRNICW